MPKEKKAKEKPKTFKIPCITHKYWENYFNKRECGKFCPDCGELLKKE